MNIDPMTQDRDDFRSRDEEYHDWCSEHGLDPEADDSRDAYAEADWHPMTGKAAPNKIVGEEAAVREAAGGDGLVMPDRFLQAPPPHDRICLDCANTGYLLLCPNDTDGDGDCDWCARPGRDHPCPNPIHRRPS